MRISDWSSDVCSSDLEIPTLAPCEPCKGTGSEDGRLETCTTCHGHGQVRMQRGIFTMQQPCPHCGGRGQTIATPCKACHGNGPIGRASCRERVCQYV